MSEQPRIILDNNNGGYHNNLPYEENLKKNAYKDLSTICIVPTRGFIHARVVQSWLGIFSPMNQKFTRLFIVGMEVGAAYHAAIEQILAHPELSKWKYVLFLEEDNMPPPDGLLKLYENMDKYDVIGGLYWTKGEGGKPMCYGRPDTFPINFAPFMPQPETVTPCYGVGMGFTLAKLEIFKNPAHPKPYFETVQKYQNGQSVGYTQDLYWCQEINKLGYRCAVDSRVKVGHYDAASDIVF